jgi:diguanylate cyclase (GGDEF)-like protein
MSAALTEDLRSERVAPVLLDSLITTFGMARGTVIVNTDAGVVATTMVGRQVASESSGPWPWPDPVAREALTTRGPVLVRRLDPADTVLNRALPDARHVVVLPLLAGRTELGVVAIEQLGRTTGVPARTLEMLLQFCAHAALALRNSSLHAEVERLATFDALTGLGNRRLFEEALGRELARASRRAGALALVLIDVDHFKAVNDEYGHQAGDEVLRRVGAAVASVARAADLAARFGGEEFVLLVPDCDETRAVGVAERVRAAIATCGGPVSVTASAGVAVGRWPGLTRDGLIRVADEALYRSKRAGRDRTTLGRAPKEATARRRAASVRR